MHSHLKSCHYVHRGLSTGVLYDIYLVQNIWAYNDMYQTLMCRQMLDERYNQTLQNILVESLAKYVS